ncbi:spondin-2-like [Hyposmocoma kahamanoa]|uniref:spondin-2-like n=1 Tax=Hyposmocoma kahamanoa TaxID=1477025 RepID=UPI000E6D70CE|nr:spondin-2-like [Hyposmocoma kahamanoa]
MIASSERCNQTPPGAKVPTPTDPKEGPFKLIVDNKGSDAGKYLPDQTYVVSIRALDEKRPFMKFMITAEGAGDDRQSDDLRPHKAEVGSLKPLQEDHIATYSATCLNTVMNVDNSLKKSVTVHWISPKTSERNQRVRFRAMVAENDEKWYAGSTDREDKLSVVLEKDKASPPDQPPLPQLNVCRLCSEARYEVIFKGQWSRGNHPLNFPEKLDEIAFETMIGTSHDRNFTLWEQGYKAGNGLRVMVVDYDDLPMHNYIIEHMNLEGGTRTLIRGKRRQYPYTSEPQHALFRVSRIHHMFSVIIQMRPSPDWFLGTSKYELCSNEGWLSNHTIPLYPWDAGVMNGVSYDSERSITQPSDNINRVGVGSFDKASPFFQMNLNDLKPFAYLTVNRLDVYPLNPEECPSAEGDEVNVKPWGGNEEEEQEFDDEPQLAESRTRCFSDWGAWSPCRGTSGACGGVGTQIRTRHEVSDDYNDWEVKPLAKCYDNLENTLFESRECFVEC